MKYICKLCSFQTWHGAHSRNLNTIVNWVFPKCFHWIRWIRWLKIFVITVKRFEPAISCVRDQDATTTPARHIQETGSLNWSQYMLQWFIRFPEFAEFSFHSGKTPMRRLYFLWLFAPKFWEVAGTYKLLFCSKQNTSSVMLTMWGSGDTQNTTRYFKKLNFMHLYVVGMQKPSKFP